MGSLLRFRHTILVLTAWSCLWGAAAGLALADEGCTHEEALEMGDRLHEELDFGNKEWLQKTPTKDEENARFDALTDLMTASDFALRGDDAEACRRYREIAQRMNIELE